MKSKRAIRMLKKIQNYRLPPFMKVIIFDLPEEESGRELMTKFLSDNFPLLVNKFIFEPFTKDNTVDVKEFLDGLLSAIPRVTNIVYLNSLSLDQEDVKQILQASFKAKCLKLKNCKFRKFIANK
jgi:hypothetical protein